VDSNDNADFAFFTADPWTEVSPFSFWEDAVTWPAS
jgi:hypothetical protein